ncbi:unnamed protein product [Rotaria magnacalcarata]|uniref:SWIM-type domain-containing protein n=1 Tax=Rotaria magnacalcarata TaxID=392030 RepID=A0A819RQ02_9BILA|nr:unnamed protein product [Rotaria magnacalcarata]CAF4051460.1 unnamed protein product [Rotaria magnacalcarata]
MVEVDFCNWFIENDLLDKWFTVQQLDVSNYRTSDLRDGTKYSYRCRYYREYPLCRYEVQIYVPDNEFTMIKLMYKNAYGHEQRNVTDRLPSPVRESVNKYVTCQLTQGQIKNALSIDYRNIPLPINQIDILHWFGNWYILPSSNPTITPAIWLQMYQMQQWQTFNDFIIWLKSCYLVSPLHSCTCPNGMKLYVCKHSFGLAMIFNIYEIKDKTRSELLGQRRGKGRSKKVKSALEF